MLKNRPYNFGHQFQLWNPTMPKRTNEALADFGTRLAELRKAAGHTQVELANELGVTRRMIAYYEGETEHPPANLLPTLARALGVTIEALLGTAPARRPPPRPASRSTAACSAGCSRSRSSTRRRSARCCRSSTR